MNAGSKRSGDVPRDAETVASATECTGLMPALPRDEEQDETQARLYAIHGAKRRDGRRQPAK